MKISVTALIMEKGPLLILVAIVALPVGCNNFVDDYLNQVPQLIDELEAINPQRDVCRILLSNT